MPIETDAMAAILRIVRIIREVMATGGDYYFVGQGGLDTNSGETWEERRLTVTGGLAIPALIAGDLLIIGPGVYAEDVDFNVDDVRIMGFGPGPNAEMTQITGTCTWDADNVSIEGIYIYQDGAIPLSITIGAGSVDHPHINNCKIEARGAGATSTVHIGGVGAVEEPLIEQSTLIGGATAAVLLIDTGTVNNPIVKNSTIRVEGGAGHGIHINNVNVVNGNIFNNNILGFGLGNTGVFIQAGLRNMVSHNFTEGFTTPYNLAVNNYLVDSHRESQILAGNTPEDDLNTINTNVLTIINERLVCKQNSPSVTSVDETFRFSISVIDNDTGPVAAGNITPGTYNLDRVRAGVTTPIVAGGVFTAVNGYLYVDIAFLAANWQTDDAYLLTPLHDSIATIGGNNYYIPFTGWSGLVTDLSVLGGLIHEVDDVIIYIVANDMGTNEITDTGASPALTAESSKANANEAAGEADPNWTEDFDFEHSGTITLKAIFFELRWQQKRTGGTTCSAKWQISGNGGVAWVDITDNVVELGAAYVNKTRIGVGRHITLVTGANQLQLRLCAWTDGASVETKVRSDSYMRITYRKS